MEHQDPLGEMEPQAMMGDLEQMADLERRGLKEAVVHLENLEYLAREDFLDQKAHEGKRGALEPQDKVEHLDWTGDRASLDWREILVLLEKRVLQDLEVLLE